MNLNQVTLPVRQMDEATRFYRTMGFLQIVDSPHYARFECPEGSATFSLSLEPGMDQWSMAEQSIDGQTIGSQSIARPGAVIYFEHQLLDEWVVELQARGLVFDQAPRDMSYLWREAVLHDPSGNKIKLYWAGENRKHPPWRVELTASGG